MSAISCTGPCSSVIVSTCCLSRMSGIKGEAQLNIWASMYLMDLPSVRAVWRPGIGLLKDFEIEGLYSALWTLRACCNSLLPVSCVPSDVLISIFSNHMTHEDWFCISHVCWAWRDLVLGNPLLWQTFPNISRSPEWTREQLHCTGSIPLDINVPIDDYGLVSHGSSWELILSQLAHIQNLKMLDMQTGTCTRETYLPD